MILPIGADPPPLRECEGGVIRIADTRIPLERVVRAFLAGATAEQIVQDYDTLTIEDVYSVISYYLRHRREVDAYLLTAAEDADQARIEIEQRCPPVGIRDRLLARRSNGTD